MSQNIDRAAFLAYVRNYVEQDPESAAYLSDYAQAGIRAALAKSNERAADMEVAVAVLAAKRYKNSDAVLMDKLSKWEGKTALDWSWMKARMEQESKSA